MFNEVYNILKLIELVKDRPGVYDFHNDDQNNRAHVEILWNEIANEMGAPIADCRKKWGSLRSALSRDIRNERVASLNKHQKKKWYLAEHLDFLRNYLIQRTKDKEFTGIDDSCEMDINWTIDESTNLLDYSSPNYELDNKSCLSSSLSSRALKESTQMTVIHEPLKPPLQPNVVFTSHQPIAAIQPASSAKLLSPPVSLPISPVTLSPPPVKLPAKPSVIIHSSPQSVSEVQHHYVNEYPSKNKKNTNEVMKLDDRNMTFFKSIIPDILRLSDRKQRLYKQHVIMKLNRFLDEEGTYKNVANNLSGII